MAAHTPMPLSISTKPQQHGANAPGLGLTPPVTPTLDGRNSTDSASSSSAVLSSVGTCSIGAVPTPPQFLDELEYQLDEKGRRVTFGSGAWSIVYKAFASPRATYDIATRPITPPSSPTTKGRLVAVKSPGRRDARAVLFAEARALTKVSSVPGSEQYIVPFHSYIADSSTIIMGAVPLSLSTHIEEKARLAQQNFSTRTMFDPVLGMPQWHDLAKKLIACLSWLHSHTQIVHGDIKPHNILLRPCTSLGSDIDSMRFPYEPLLADFSSAHSINTSESGSENETPSTALSAVTPPFTAPELLRALSSPDPITPAPASDVFSLAVTLLAAATGDLLIYSGFSAAQRLMVAKDGHMVIDFARSSGSNGTRVPKGGLVEGLVKPAIAKDPAARVTSIAWLELAMSLSV
ncbi:protein kinase domain-containing protein [Aspergillus undulatus]|uniref:protein kinase domain-containing protein n=1 Tax=Aspergillus undulatus TaxID=1810928 RepID=UPI003CCD60F6